MFKKALAVFLVLFFAFSILFISILRSASIRYSFQPVYADLNKKNDSEVGELNNLEIDYYLAYPGTVLPDSPLWKLKALRDRLWLVLTTNIAKKAELNLLFADKRLMAAEKLFERKKFTLGYSTLTKAEKYLEEASALEEDSRKNTNEPQVLAERIEKASLMHILKIKEMALMTPEDLSPKLVDLEILPRRVYKNKVEFLKFLGHATIKDPFTGE